jgi:hypothetical protein
MPDLRQSFAATAYAGLGGDQNSERPVDRVGASAWAKPLGIALWKAKYQSAASAYRTAAALLAALYRDLVSRYEGDAVVRLIVDQCLYEFLCQNCEMCSGRREIVAEDLRVVCMDCGGTGVQRHTDLSRARRMGMSLARLKNQRMQSNLRKLSEIISRHDLEVNYVMAHQLERG